MKREATLVGGHGALDPGVVVAHLGVHTGLVPHSAAVAPGHNTLQSSAADDWAAGVTLDQHGGKSVSKGVFAKSDLSTWRYTKVSHCRTWQESFPPSMNPAQNMLEVI